VDGNSPLSSSKALRFIIRRWALFFLATEFIIFSVSVHGFFTLRTLQNIFFFGVTYFLLGTGETFVIITGGMDLSVGFVFGFASIISAKITVGLVSAGVHPAIAVLVAFICTLLIGLIPGLLNGTLVARLKVPPFIATFSMLGITHGISELILSASGLVKNIPYLASQIGNGFLFYFAPGYGFSFFTKPEVRRGDPVYEFIPNIVVIVFIFVLVFAFILKRTKFGQYVYAIGGNVEAAKRVGINVDWTLTKTYMISSFLATLGGIVYMFQYTQGKADAGASFLLDSIVAVVIGGASMYGGSGTIGGTILGALVLAVLETGLRVKGIPTFDKYILVGVILIATVLIDQFMPELKKSPKEI
jgi:ribose transport system permease protein